MDSAITKRKKKRKSNNAIVENEGQSLDLKNTIDTGLTSDAAQGNLVLQKFKIEDEVAPIENVSGKRAKKRKRNSRAEIDDGGNLTTSNTDPTEMDTENVIIGSRKIQDETRSNGQAQSLVEGIDAGKGREKKKRKKKKAAVVDEVQQEMEENHIADEKVIIEHPGIRDEAQIFSEGSANGRRRKKRKEKKGIVNEPEIGEGNVILNEPAQTQMQAGLEENVTVDYSIVQDDIRSIENPIMGEGNATVARKKKPKKKKVTEVVDELSSVQENHASSSVLETGGEVHSVAFTRNLTKGSVNFEIPKVQDEVQSIETRDEGNVVVTSKKKPKKKKVTRVVDELSSVPENHASISVPETGGEVHSVAFTENLTKGSVNFEIPKVQDEVQSIENPSRDEGNVDVTRKKPKKKKAKVKDELSGRIDTASTEIPAEVNVNISVPETRGDVHSVDLNENLTKESVSFVISKVLKEIRSIENAVSDEGNAAVTSKKKPKKKKKAKVEDELSGRIDTRSTENPAEVNVNISIPETRGEVHSVALKENLTKESAKFEIPKVQDEMQSIDNPIMDEGNVTVTRKKKPKKKMPKVEVELSERIDTGSTENLAELNANISIPETRSEVHSVDEVQSIDNPIMDEGNVTVTRKKKPKKKKMAKVEDELAGVEVHSVALKENLTKESVNFEIPKVQDEIQSIENPIRDEGNVTPKKKKKPRKKKAAGVMSLNGSSQVLDEGRSATSTSNGFAVKDAEVLCCRTVPFAPHRRKLLVLDLNGMLADIIYDAPKNCQADAKICGRAVFKRPFCDDFLKFCFQNFHVGIWSSRTKRIIDPIVSFLLGDLEAKLAFIWDMMYTTKSGLNTLENRHKPLVCKDLRKIWEHDDPSWPWKKGDYNESNTLLLDDSPYKALLNPPHTAIFPPPYEYTMKNDNSLGPGGDLRVYLEGLVTSENVQTYVKEHPFGQLPISEQSISWEFYKGVINKMSKLVNDEARRSVVKA